MWGGKDIHLRGAAQFPTANTPTRGWWELNLLLGVELWPILFLAFPLFPSSFSVLKLLSPLRRILASLHPADQWQNIWLWFCRQCHRCRAKHWAISPWQQGKSRRNKLSCAPKSFNWTSTVSVYLLVSVHKAWCYVTPFIRGLSKTACPYIRFLIDKSIRKLMDEIFGKLLKYSPVRQIHVDCVGKIFLSNRLR